MILFETTASVFEALWDIALALFIIQISFFYFLLSFLTSCIITYFRISSLQPIYLLTQPQAELVTLPLWLLSTVLWARLTIVIYDIPQFGGLRLTIGILALVFLLVAELAGGVFIYERGYTPWIWETDLKAAGVGVVVMALFGLMPLLLMGSERRTDETGKTYHEQKKAIANPV